jgi:hypothetical protein
MLTTLARRGGVVRGPVRAAGATRRALASAAPKLPLHINGKSVQSQGTQWMDVHNPATQDVICQVTAHGAGQQALGAGGGEFVKGRAKGRARAGLRADLTAQSLHVFSERIDLTGAERLCLRERRFRRPPTLR